MIKQSQSNFGDCYHLIGEEVDFSSLRNEFLTVSPEGLGSILRFPCGEITEKWFRRKRKLNFFTKMNRRVSKRTMEQFYLRRWNWQISIIFIYSSRSPEDKYWLIVDNSLIVLLIFSIRSSNNFYWNISFY